MDTLLEEAAKENVIILLPDEFRQSRKHKQLRRGAAVDSRRDQRGSVVHIHEDRDGVQPSTAPAGEGR
jgi:hypothetical protein